MVIVTNVLQFLDNRNNSRSDRSSLKGSHNSQLAERVAFPRQTSLFETGGTSRVALTSRTDQVGDKRPINLVHVTHSETGRFILGRLLTDTSPPITED